jgi:hypothetical protein
VDMLEPPVPPPFTMNAASRQHNTFDGITDPSLGSANSGEFLADEPETKADSKAFKYVRIGI